MFQDGMPVDGHEGPYSANGETADNQARLEYYTDDNTRLKAWQENLEYYPDLRQIYWMGSVSNNADFPFCGVNYEGLTDVYNADNSDVGVAPAFCVW
jgi:hypothetical protein